MLRNFIFCSFPRDDALFEVWCTAIRQSGNEVSFASIGARNARVCAVHFQPEDFKMVKGKQKLQRGAFPSIFGGRCQQAFDRRPSFRDFRRRSPAATCVNRIPFRNMTNVPGKRPSTNLTGRKPEVPVKRMR